MEKIERGVRSWIASQDAVDIDDIISTISSGEATLLDVVKALGEYLTSEEDAFRTRGVEFLSLVIQGVPENKLNKQAVHVLALFFCSKLEDTEAITPALTGLVHLVKLPALSSSDIPDIINSLFTHVKMRVLVQSTRFLVFSIIQSLMTSHRPELKNMGDQFVDGYATLALGEKDPRNLMAAFAIAHTILTEFDTSKQVENYFDITFCYFPITFRPPPNDPYKISVDDLKASLQRCLSATPAFGHLGTPLFLEKLTAGSPATKRDSLHAISASLPIYGPEIAREHGTNIWNTLKLEIFQPVDSLTENAALETIQAFVRVLQPIQASTEDAPSSNLDELALQICEDCLEAVSEPENEKAKAGIKILCSLIGIEQRLSLHVMTHAIEALVKIFHDPMELSHRAQVIILLTELLKSLEPVDSLTSTGQSAPKAGASAVHSHLLLAPSKDSLIGVLMVGLKASSTRLPAVQGLSGLIRIPSAVTDDELGYIVLEVGELVGKESDEVEDITHDVLSLLSSIAVLAPQHVATQILPPLFASLPDRAPARQAQSERTAYWRALQALSALCTHPALFETFVVRLTTKLDLLCSTPFTSMSTPSPTSQDMDDIEHTVAYAHAILVALRNSLSSKVSRPQADPDVIKCVNTLLPHLFRLCIGAALESNQQVLTDTRLLLVVVQIIRLVIQSSPVEAQKRIFGGLTPAFLDGQIGSVTGGELTSLEFRPMHPCAGPLQRNTVLLYAAAQIPMRSEVTEDATKLSSHLKDLVSWCGSQQCTRLQREAVSQLLASLVNKHVEEIPEFIAFELEDHWSTVVNDRNIPADDRRDALAIWISVTKALLVRSHSSATAFIDKLFTLLDDDAIDLDAARAFGALATSDDVLTKQNGTVLKILYAQKYFSGALPRILIGAKYIGGSRRETAYLIALASLVNAVPKALYVSQMSTLMPLLIRGLDLEDLACRADIVNTLTNAIDAPSDEKSLLPEYASTLVTSVLKNTIVTYMPDPKVRIASLKYLALLPGVIRYDVLHPHKSHVLRELGKALDDPKRAVRKEAVEARIKWFKYSG